MFKEEKRYSFRKELLSLHKKNIRDYSKVPLPNDKVLADQTTIVIPKDAGDVLLTAAKDFVDYLFASQGVSAALAESKLGTVIFEILPSENISKAKRMEYFISIENDIKISAYHERGLAQGLYRLEHIMSQNKAPYLTKGKLHGATLFSPRMVHSAYGLDLFPNEYLSHLAHNGIDAIIVGMKGVDKAFYGFLDFNELCYRASRYGIDVYAYSHLRSSLHPDDEKAEEFYDNLYGKIFKNCPDLAGVVLVGESVLFPSRDKDTNGKAVLGDEPHDIPLGKPNPGWWPCKDYPLLVKRIRDSARKYSPQADIIFWTYNWGYAPETERINLINLLPTDISLLVTFEMFEKYSMENIDGYCADYTLSFAGPGKYYLSEAKAASSRGIRLYAMSNTAGKTWDFGAIPYEPMPYQWIKRYKGLKKSHYEHGLSGLMESHTFGLYPSFISELANLVFSMPDCDEDILLSEVLSKYYGEENVAALKSALTFWSDAITYYIPSNEDQYGAFRIGAAYPFCFIKKFLPKADDMAINGPKIVMPDFEFPYLDFSPPLSMRIDDEIVSLEKMKKLMLEGNKILKTLDISKNDELRRLLNLGEYIYLTIRTGINAKKWHILKSKIHNEKNKDSIFVLLEDAKKLLNEEIKNAEAAILLVKADSTFGFEQSMGYLGDAEQIEWKIQQVEYVINVELNEFKKRIV